MKLRIRSAETKETLRVEVSDLSSLLDLKILIAAKLSPAVTPDSIRLSLNRKDELLPPSPSDPLHTLGLTSGDLLFFSLASIAPSAPADAAIPTPDPPPLMIDSGTPPPSDAMVEAAVGTLDPKSLHPEEGTSTLTQGDLMEVDSETPVIKKPSPVPCFLKRVMEAEKGEARGDLGRLVIAVHAVFLESGFVVSGSRGAYGSRLPEGWASATAAVSIQYNFPDLAVQNDVKVVILKFSAMGKYVSVYGFVSGDHPDVYRLCLEGSKLAPSLGSSVDAMCEEEEKDVFKLWRTVKDGLALPLLIDFCDKNGLPLPPCFTRLPTELKIKILEFLPGVDVARAACADSELKYLSSNNELWKQKFLEEFGLLDERGLIGCCWRDKFARCWAKAKNANKRTRRETSIIYGIPNTFAPRHNLFAPQRFPMIGGDYDLFPAIGGFGMQGSRTGFPHLPGFPRLPGRRNFSPQCNLGGRDSSFSM